MGDARRLTLSELRALVADPAELEKGVRIFDADGLSLLSRHEGRLFCEAAGSGAAPYRVSVALEDAGAKARCSCMAARSRPFCKHAAALLVAWARAPEAFAVSEAPPPEPAAGGGPRRRAVKAGKTDAKELLGRGVEQAGTLVRELAVAGVASLAAGRSDAIRGLAGSLREARLRRLSARTLALADLLDAGQRGALDAPAYAGLLADMLLAVRKLEKHLGGEPLEPRHAEELLGKTWRKEDRVPVEGLDLVEYAFVGRETADGYVIRERRLLDLASGSHLAEKQILPAFLAKRTEPLRSRAGQRLRDARGSRYPGYVPHRLDLDDGLAATPLDAEGVRAFASRCLPGAGAALSAFAEHRRDPFAPDAFPVAVRVGALLARDGRLLALDADGAALHLPADDALEERLAMALRSERLLAIAGDLDLEAALPVLTPLAVAVEGAEGASLVPLGAAGEVLTAAPRLTSPLEAARRAGASGAGIALAEVREELAHLLAAGLSGLVPRATDALAARLRDLGLAKPADLLDAVARRPEPADRLDDLVKLYQVLEIALVRRLGAATADRAALVASPTYESVLVPRPDAPLDPDEVGRLRASGRMSRYEAAWHLEHHYRSLPAEKLAARVFTAWADGSASPFVIRACAGRGAEALAAAERALALPTGRVAKLTALKVLEAVGGESARAALASARADARDPLMRVEATSALVALAAREPAAPPARSGGVLGALRRLAGGGTPQDEDHAGALATRRKAVEADLAALRDASLSDDRVRLVERLVQSGNRLALPALRAAAAADPAGPVRLAALRALGALCDVESVDALARLLAARDRDEERAKAAADALGLMGDRRGIAPLVDAFADGWKPTVIGEALLAIGAPAIEPLVAALEQRPDLVARKVSLALLQRVPPADLSAVLLDRLGSLRARLALRHAEAEWPAAAAVHLKLAAAHRDAEVAVAKVIVSTLAAPASKEERALRRAAEKALSPPAGA
jgi:hypothetical protein